MQEIQVRQSKAHGGMSKYMKILIQGELKDHLQLVPNLKILQFIANSMIKDKNDFKLVDIILFIKHFEIYKIYIISIRLFKVKLFHIGYEKS